MNFYFIDKDKKQPTDQDEADICVHYVDPDDPDPTGEDWLSDRLRVLLAKEGIDGKTCDFDPDDAPDDAPDLMDVLNEAQNNLSGYYWTDVRDETMDTGHHGPFKTEKGALKSARKTMRL